MKMLHPLRSIAGRLTLRIMVTSLTIFAIVAAVIYAIVFVIGLAMTVTNYQSVMEFSNERINNVFTSVEVAIANNIPEVEESLSNPDKLEVIVDRILRLNPQIVGSSIAFRPGFFPQRQRLFAPYAYRSGQQILLKQLGTPEYNYPEREWYRKPVELGRPYWSDPYFDKEGGNINMVTYSLPLMNSVGEAYAVITADIAIDWIADMIDHADSINNGQAREFFLSADSASRSYSFIVGHDGVFIAHPDKEVALHKNILDLARETKGQADNEVARAMLSGERGWRSFADAADDNADILDCPFCFYAPLERTGWSMGVVLPLRSLLRPGNKAGVLFLHIIGIGVIVMFLVCFISIRRVTRPLRSFAQSADEIAKGHIDTELPVIKTKDEMRRLHDSFETMQRSLVRQIEKTRTVNAEKGRIEGELQTAREIQMSMLPKTFPAFPDRADIDVYGQQTPAKEVGGDLFDFFIRDEKLFFCVGDVSGKGVPASLVMAVTRTLFRTVSSRESNPGKIVSSINDVTTANNESDMFVTLFLGVLDLPTGRLRYCNAGHCAPLLLGSGVGVLPVAPNLPLGIVEKFEFQRQEAIVSPGTTIFLYTDGLTEAENTRHELFGDSRLLEAASEVFRRGHIQPNQIVGELTEAVHAFVGEAEQSDDLTMMAIQYQNKQQDNVRLRRSLTLPNDVESIPQLNEFIDAVAEDIQLDMSLTMSLNLAIEEAVVNVMSYAYPAGVAGEVNIEACADSEWLTFVISDAGTPFDPTAKEEADTTLSVEDRPVGGLGIFLVRQLMDTINYERADGMNILTLRKRVGGEEDKQE